MFYRRWRQDQLSKPSTTEPEATFASRFLLKAILKQAKLQCMCTNPVLRLSNIYTRNPAEAAGFCAGWLRASSTKAGPVIRGDWKSRRTFFQKYLTLCLKTSHFGPEDTGCNSA